MIDCFQEPCRIFHNAKDTPSWQPRLDREMCRFTDARHSHTNPSCLGTPHKVVRGVTDQIWLCYSEIRIEIWVKMQNFEIWP